MEKDAQFLEFLIKSLVDYPNDVKIKRTVDEMGGFWLSTSIRPIWEK